MYIAVRDREGRLYSDEQLKRLPVTEPAHIHFKEWQIRKKSATRLFNYLQNKNKPLSILEVGCGNGWLAAMLAAIPDSAVTGCDINKTELCQARRVFNDRNNIIFVEEDIQGNYFQQAKFDIIVFAASIYYFPSFEAIIRKAISLLKPIGEIHIIDSFFYNGSEKEAAKKRSLLYYQSIGFTDMSDFYFHHDFNALNKFKYRVLFNPESFANKLFSRKAIFPWICIKK